MQQTQPELEFVIASISIIFVFVIFLILLFSLFQKKKNTFLLNQKEAQKQFEKEIAESQVEIREQTLRNISWELHDNIGQLLTLAKIQLQSIKAQPENIPYLNENLTNILNEVRALSKIINPDFIGKISLEEAVKLEISRFNRLNYINAKFDIEGIPYRLNDKTEIVIFRILQEFFSNTIKHSKAHNLQVLMQYSPTKFEIEAIDDGIGFDLELQKNSGLGLTNMRKRGKLVQCQVDIISALEKGTILKITYNT